MQHTSPRLRLLLSWGALLFGAACGEEAAPPAEPQAADESRAPEVPAPNLSESVDSSAGTWRVEWTFDPPQIAVNELFDVRARVLRGDGEATPAEIELAVDAGMPQHQHGMVRRVRMHREEATPTDFRAEGLLFHMPGEWRLYFDVSYAGLTERAECIVTLD